MSNVHIRQIEDARGDLVDLEYYHHGCAPADVPGWPAPGATWCCVPALDNRSQKKRPPLYSIGLRWNTRVNGRAARMPGAHLRSAVTGLQRPSVTGSKPNSIGNYGLWPVNCWPLNHVQR